MPNTIVIDDYTISITEIYDKNMYVGEFINTSEFSKLYGDSFNEIICKAEELIKGGNKIELCRDQN